MKKNNEIPLIDQFYSSQLNEQIKQKMHEVYLRVSKRYLHEIEELPDDTPLEQIYQKVHRLYGASATIGASRLAKFSKSICEGCRNGDLSSWNEKKEELVSIYHLTINQLKE